jgi:hypothetical protein
MNQPQQNLGLPTGNKTSSELLIVSIPTGRMENRTDFGKRLDYESRHLVKAGNKFAIGTIGKSHTFIGPCRWERYHYWPGEQTQRKAAIQRRESAVIKEWKQMDLFSYDQEIRGCVIDSG